MNILSNFVPHRLLKFNYKQHPWMNPKNFLSLRKRVKLIKLFLQKSIPFIKRTLMSKSTECSNLILRARDD